MKKFLSILLAAVMIFSVLSLTVAADTTYSVAVDGEGNPLNPYVINNDIWVKENGGIKMPEGKLFSFLLFDTPLTTNRVEATFENMSLSGSGDDRNGIVFALTNHAGDATLDGEGDAGVSFYWAYITGWNGEYRVAVLKMGKYNNWEMISAGGWATCGKTFTELGVENSGEKVTLAAEWDNAGHIKVYVNGVLAEDITDTTGTPLAGNLYGVLTRRWANYDNNREAYTDTLTSFVAGGKSTPTTPDTPATPDTPTTPDTPATPTNPNSYSNCKDDSGNRLNPVFINNTKWQLSGGKLTAPAGSAFNFLLFDNKLSTKRIEAKFVIPDNGAWDGDHRNGLVFAFTDHDGDATIENNWAEDISYYWAFINDWGCVEVAKMGKYNNWTWLSTQAADLSALGIDVANGVKLAAEWDNNGHIKVYANGILVQDITDTTGNPLSGNLYGVLQFQWSSLETADATYITSFRAGEPTSTGDTTVLVSLIALVAAMGTGIVISKKRRFN